MLGEGHGGLPGAAGAVPDDPTLRTQLRQIVEQRRRVSRPEGCIFGGQSGEVILEAHGKPGMAQIPAAIVPGSPTSGTLAPFGTLRPVSSTLLEPRRGLTLVHATS